MPSALFDIFFFNGYDADLILQAAHFFVCTQCTFCLGFHDVRIHFKYHFVFECHPPNPCARSPFGGLLAFPSMLAGFARKRRLLFWAVCGGGTVQGLVWECGGPTRLNCVAFPHRSCAPPLLTSRGPRQTASGTGMGVNRRIRILCLFVAGRSVLDVLGRASLAQ